MNKNDMIKIKYSIYKPGGNDTALVYGIDYTKEQKKIINDKIMQKHPYIEQVGFISLSPNPELQMAGGEFCGNATRCAAYMYLNAKEGKLQMLVNSKEKINVGVDKYKKAWCELPIYNVNDMIIEKEPGIFIVKMNGIIIIVIKEKQAEKYLEDKENLKDTALKFISKYELINSKAVGVIFCEKENEILKINPVVWVKAIDTVFFETACGSGTMAVGMLESFNKKQNRKIDVLQPSGMVITAKVFYENEEINKLMISGDIENDENVYNMEI